MTGKRLHTAVRLDRDDIGFFQQMQKDGIFQNNAEAIRWCVKFCRLYGIAGIKKIRSDSK